MMLVGMVTGLLPKNTQDKVLDTYLRAELIKYGELAQVREVQVM
jgi:hypothetical protein